MDNKRKRRNRYCSVPDCGAKCTSEIFPIKFPEDENLRKKWAEALKFDKEITECMFVCSLHFVSKDFKPSDNPKNRRELKKDAVPSERLPYIKSKRLAERRALKKKNNTMDIVGNSQKNDSSTQSSPPIERDHLYCREISSFPRKNKRIFSMRNSDEDSPSKKRNIKTIQQSKRISKRIQKKNVPKPFDFVGVEMVDPLEISVPRPKRTRKVVANTRRFGNSLKVKVKNRTVPRSKSVGIQTKSRDVFDKTNGDMNIQQVSLRRSVDYLRENLIGHIIRIKENIFTINECSISFKNADSEEINVLVVQPDKLASSGKLLEAILGSSEIDRLQEPRRNKEQISNVFNNSTQEYSGNGGALQFCEVEMNDNVLASSTPRLMKHARDSVSNISSIKEKKFKVKDKTAKDPVFDKEVKVLVNKLPENLVKAIEDGYRVRMRSKGFLEEDNEGPTRKFEVKEIPKVTPVPAKVVSVKFSCDICKQNFPTLTDLSEHKKIHQDISETGEIQNNNERACNPIEVVQDEIHDDTLPEEKKFNCDLCHRVFKYFHTYKFHKKVMHNCKNQQRKYKELLNEEMNNEESQKDGKNQETCPECLGVYQSMKQLDRHLLKCHQIVLRKSLYQCDYCPKIFITYRSLLYHKTKSHNMTVNENVEIKSKCPNCEKLFDIHHYKAIHSKECTKDNIQTNMGKIVETTTTPTAVQYSSDPLEEEMERLHSSSYSHEESSNGITITKRKNTLNSENCDSENENVENKKLKLGEDVEEGRKCGGSSSEILDRLRTLLGSSDGPNDITIELDE